MGFSKQQNVINSVDGSVGTWNGLDTSLDCSCFGFDFIAKDIQMVCQKGPIKIKLLLHSVAQTPNSRIKSVTGMNRFGTGLFAVRNNIFYVQIGFNGGACLFPTRYASSALNDGLNIHLLQRRSLPF